jgi:hypothetical protein
METNLLNPKAVLANEAFPKGSSRPDDLKLPDRLIHSGPTCVVTTFSLSNDLKNWREAILLSLDPSRVVLFALSTTRLPRMATAVLEISYLDPVIPDEKAYFFRPGHIHLKIREKGSGIWFFLFYFMMIHGKVPFSMICIEIFNLYFEIIIYKTSICQEIIPATRDFSNSSNG